MTRTQRLLELLQILHTYRYPVAGKTLAIKLGVSLRTLYRDIETLQEQGAIITTEKGRGYKLETGLTLPPLMFTQEEIEALLVGSRWTISQADSQLGSAAEQAIAKILRILSQQEKDTLNASLLIGYPKVTAPYDEALILLRKAIKENKKISINYMDNHQNNTVRVIWPFAIGFFSNALVLCGWCELREAFRHFRLDRITTLNLLDEPFPRNQKDLLTAWHHFQKIPKPIF